MFGQDNEQSLRDRYQRGFSTLSKGVNGMSETVEVKSKTSKYLSVYCSEDTMDWLNRVHSAYCDEVEPVSRNWFVNCLIEEGLHRFYRIMRDGDEG